MEQDAGLLREIEVWSGHRLPPDPHRLPRLLGLLGLLAGVLLVFSGCATSRVRVITTDPDGVVTDTTTLLRGMDPASMRLAAAAAEIYLPRRAMIVREEKSAAVLRGWRGRQEIAARWRPAAP